jgi:hypothetical protein
MTSLSTSVRNKAVRRFKPIPGFPDYYVSFDGIVISYVRNENGHTLKPGLGSNGYFTVALGRGNSRCIHELVALTWIGPRPQGFDVAHKDSDKQNNDVDNLQYKTRTENNYDISRHDRRSRVSRSSVARIKNGLALGATAREVADEHGLSESYVSAVKHGKLRPHG